LDLHVNASRKIELHQRVDRLRGGLDDIEHALVRAYFAASSRTNSQKFHAPREGGPGRKTRRRGLFRADEFCAAPSGFGLQRKIRKNRDWTGL